MFGLLGLIKGVAVVCSMAFALPVGGVYASADSPSKYLDRLTTVNSSASPEDGGGSSGVEDEPTVSRAVRTSHGVILNTVVRNANRLEYVDDVPVITGADRVEPVHETVTRSAVSANDGNEHTVNPVNTNVSVDGQAQGIEWPEGGFTGESTITYDANGKGTFADGATTNAVTTRYDSAKEVTEYAHTDNVDDAGVQNGGYGNNKSYSRVVTIPGASSLTVNLTYQTESVSYDWVCAYTGGTESSPAGDAQCSTSLTGKLGGTTKTTKSFTVDGDSVTFWFKSNGSVSGYYGYYAAVKGLVGSKESVSGTYAAPVDPSGEYKFSSWNTKPDGTGENLGAGEVYSQSSQTVYAQWSLGSNYTKWGTVGWRITDDGVLKIRPWEGDTGTTGAVPYYSSDVPWNSQRSNIKKIESTGTIVLNTNSAWLFYDCSSLTDLTGLAGWNASNVTDMSDMFSGCSNLTDLAPLANWNVSNVTNMGSMFSGCSSLTDLTALVGWNVSNVTGMSYLFRGCSNLTDITTLGSWNVSKVTNMQFVFSDCSNLTNISPLAGWNVSNVKIMNYMFSGCSNLTDITALESWDVSNVTTMDYMFYYCSKLTDLTALESWDMSKVTDMKYMFQNCSSLTSLTGLENWSVSKVTTMVYMFSGCSNLTDITALASWDVSNVKSMTGMFSNCTRLVSLRGLENWKTTSLTSMATNYVGSGMFYNCASLSNLFELANWDVSNVTDMYSLFSGCSNLTNLTALANWNVSNVTNMSSMFSGCSNLTDLSALANWNVSNVTNMRSMFYNCSNLTDLTTLADWNVSSVTTMNSMFFNCSHLTDLTALADWNVSKVTDMGSMLSSCSSLTDLTGLAGWDVSKVTSMGYMFSDCSSLNDLTALANWNVSNVTNMGSMFSGCSSLTDLTGLENWNVSSVTKMYYTFNRCSKLTNISELADWNVSKVSTMQSMFDDCSSLTDLTGLENWNVTKVKDMFSMFDGCRNLQKIGIPSISNGGQKIVNTGSAWLDDYMPTIISEGFTMGPYSWSQLNSEMQTNPDAFQDGTIWIKYTPSWMVTYHANGGVSSMPGSMTPVNQLLTLPESSFLRFGYKFTGWTTQPNPVSDTNTLMKPGQIFNPSDKTDGKKYTLYAQWEKLSDTGDQPTTGQSGMLPGWIQVDSDNTKADITPNQSQSAVFTNKYDPGLTSIQFKFTKLMDGNVPDSGESFQFELFSVSENKVIQTTTNTGASVQFQPIVYDKGGVYTYYVRESESNNSNNVNDNPNLDYDDHIVEVVVTVTEEEDPTSPSGKKLKATAQVTGDTIFRNDSKPASIDITKTVTGVTEGMNDNHRDREFRFNVNLLDRDNQPVSGKTYPTMSTNNSESGESDGNTSPSTSSITFDATGNATVKLKAGSKLTINGIPAYYKYTITETDIPAGYDNTSLTNPSGVLGANSHVIVDAVNQYTVAPASVSLQAGKTLLAPGGLNQSVNNGEFRFSLCQVTPAPIGLEAGPNVESCAGVSEASNDGNGLVTFPQLTFDTPGTYTYQIREVKGDTLDMTYDSTVYTATVNVTDDGEGRLVAKVTYRSNTTGVESSPGSSSVWDPSDPGSMGVPVFVNRTTVANRLPVTGGSDIIIASVILALILSGGLFVLLRRNREE